MVVCLLQSIISGQMLEALSIGLTARSVEHLNIDKIEQFRYRLLFRLAEIILGGRKEAKISSIYFYYFIWI